MKIGIDIRLIGKKQTGSEAVFFNLVKNLASIDRTNNYLLFTDMADQKVLKKIKKDLDIADKNNFEVVSLTRPSGTLSQRERGIWKKIFRNKFSWNFWTLPTHLRKNPVDMYLTQYITPFFVPKKIKIATIIHDISFVRYSQFIKFFDLFFLRTLIPVSLRRADKIIGVSKFTRQEIIDYYRAKPQKVDYIYNAVSEDFLKADVSWKKIEAVREKYQLPEKYILYIGTMQPRKNIPILIDAFAKLLSKPAKLDSIKLVIAGGKGHNYDTGIDAAIKKHGLEKRVLFTGFVDEEDKAAVMSAAEVFCLPSLYEGFGIPILEAMSAGVAVVSSDIAPHREIAQEAALFFDPGSSSELSEKLLEVLNNNKQKASLARKGKLQAQKFSWRNTAEKMKKIFESMKQK